MKHFIPCRIIFIALFSLYSTTKCSAFLPADNGLRKSIKASPEILYGQNDDIDYDEVAGKFKILTCTSTACAKKRKVLGLDEYSTYGAFFSRIKNENYQTVQLDECPCLGACKNAPVVAIQHDDFEGTVSLSGMNDAEFNQKVFHKIIDEGDADRVWSCVENAVVMMAEMEDEEEEE